jgi:hypothetical protein
VYKELPPNELIDIRRELHLNPDLADEFHKICESMDMLVDLDLTPSDSSIDIIMEHSLLTHEETTQ